MLNQWITSFGSATAAGLDPRRRTSKHYIQYSASKGGWVGAVPHNILIDAKTRKVLVSKVSLSAIESTIAQYHK